MDSAAVSLSRFTIQAYVEVCDDSLAYDTPPISAGDVLEFAAGLEPVNGQLAVIVIDGEVLVRYFYQAPGGLIRLEAKNLNYPPIWRKSVEACVLGRVRAHPIPNTIYREGKPTP